MESESEPESLIEEFINFKYSGPGEQSEKLFFCSDKEYTISRDDESFPNQDSDVSEDQGNNIHLTPSRSPDLIHEEETSSDEEHESWTQPSYCIPKFDPLIQNCIFCFGQFQSKSEILSHLKNCNPLLEKVMNTKENHCLVCDKKWPSFSVCGLVRHVISCLIEERESVELVPDIEPNGELEEEKEELDPEMEVYELKENQESDTDYTDKEDEINRYKKAKFTKKNILILERFAGKNSYPTERDKKTLGNKVRLTSKQVQGWFERYRFKQSREKFEIRSRTQKEKEPYSAPSSHSKGTINQINTSSSPSYSFVNLAHLLESFTKNSFPDNDEIERLAQITKLEMINISDWFINHRSLEEEKSKEEDQSKDEENGIENWGKRKHFVKAREKIKLSLQLSQRYPAWIMKILERYFKLDHCLTDLITLFEISNETGLSLREIKKWFKSQRRVRLIQNQKKLH